MKKFQRPRPGETDEDLIKQNEEFLKELQLKDKTPSSGNNNDAAKSEHRTDAAQKRPTMEEILKQFNISSAESHESEEAEVEAKDRQAVVEPVYEELGMSIGSVQKNGQFPFLQVKEKDHEFTDITPKISQPKKKLSKFAKSRLNADTVRSAIEPIPSSSKCSRREQEPIGGSIHPLLEGMTEAEILEEQQRLIQKMDPKLVEFVRSMKKHTKPPIPKSTDTLPPPPPAKLSKSGMTAEEAEGLPINPAEVETLPRMDKVETQKLLWTLPPKPKSEAKASNKPEERNARFDFHGKLLTEEEEKDPKTWLKGLHNHEDEMQRPGYSLDELLRLSMSANAGQRAAAFDTFAEILRNAHDGMFDFMLGKSVFDLCLEMDWVYALRKGLDHSDTLTVNAAVNCLSALLYPEREEMCLDTILTWNNSEVGPCIVPEKDDTTDLMEKLQPKSSTQEQNDDKDFQIACRDLIEFFIHRGCLLERFQYLLSSKADCLTTFGLINMLKILVRIGRHSPEIISKDQIILDYFVNHHLHLDTSKASDTKRNQKMEGIPFLLFLKLLRILISSSKDNADTVMQIYEVQIFSAIEENLSCSATFLQIVPQIELLIQQSIQTWMFAAAAGYGVDRFFAFTPITLKFFNLYLAKSLLNTFDLNHSALIVALLLKCLRKLDPPSLQQCIRQFSPLIEQFVVKTCIILSASHLEEQVDLDASLAALHQCLEFLIYAKAAINFQSQCASKIDEFLCTPAFEKITRRLIKSSLLLCKPVKTKANFEQRYPKNLIFTEAVLFGGNLSPLLREGYFAYVFLTSLHRYSRLVTFKNATKLINKQVQDYLQKIITAQSYHNKENYFLKFELLYLREVLEALNATQQQTLAQASYKLCSICRIDCKDLSKSFLNKFLLTFTGRMSQEEITDLFNLYCEMIDLESDLKSGDAFHKWRTQLLPPSFLAEPLKAVQSSLESLVSRDPNMSESERKKEELRLKDATLGFRIIVWRVLRFIQLCVATNSLQDVLSQTKVQFVDFYTKVCHVFLMSPTIFLYQPVRDNLQEIFQYFCNHKILATSKKSAVFTRADEFTNEFVGPSFESFYSQLLTEFSSSSYGDEVFSAYVLLPLRIQESKKIKVRFWNDVCVRFVRLQRENNLLPLSYFTGSKDVVETDVDVLRAYEAVLRAGSCSSQRNPFLYDILRFFLSNSPST